jgi:hypothetical protein
MSEQQAMSLPTAGLMTDPGPFTAAPDGGMVEAQTVVVLRPGVMEPRPGSKWFKDSVLKAGNDDAAAIYGDTQSNVFVWADAPWIIRKNASTTITGPTVFIPGKIRVAATGGRALFTSEHGICTLPGQLASPANGSATVAYRAGLPQPYCPGAFLTAVGSTWLLTNYAVAYRVTLRRRLADGSLLESAPSNRVIVRNNSGGTRAVTIASAAVTGAYQAWRTSLLATNPFGDLLAGDELCIYRSPAVTPSTSEPSDEMRLVVSLPYNTTYQAFIDPYDSAPPTAWTDRVPEASLNGTELYTNASEEAGGLASANFRPEYARDIALYNGMTFYAGAKTSQRLDLRLRSIGDTASPQTSLVTRVFAGTCAIAIGTNTITGIGAADMAFLSVGQLIQDVGTSPIGAPADFPANTRITAILSATSVQVSANALVTKAAATLTAWDYIQVSDASFTLRLFATPAGSGLVLTGNNEAEFDQTVGAQLMEVQWNGHLAAQERWRTFQLRVTGVTSRSELIVSFFRVNADDASFTVKSTKPAAWDRYVDFATGVTSQQQGGVAELRWSKINEPEHCPVPYRRTIGDASSAIRRIVVAKQSLLIFKDDGLFQIYGSLPTDLASDLVDSTIVLPAPKQDTADEPSKWVGRFDDRVFAMTTRGPMVLTDTGGVLVGAPILESLRRRFVAAFGAFDESLRALMIDTRARRVGFFYDTDGTGATTSGYVLDVETGMWTFWTFMRPIASFSELSIFGAPIFAGGYAYGYMSDDRTMLDDASLASTALPDTYESWEGESCTVTNVTGTGPYTVTIAAGSEWTPAVGDLLCQSETAHEVTAITSATVFTTATAPTVAAAEWREGFECRVVWLARAEGNAGQEKHWIDVMFPLELSALFGRAKAYFKGYRNTSAAVETAMNATTTNGVAPYALAPAWKRFSVPRSHASDWALRIGFTIRQACVWFSTAGVSVIFERADAGMVNR